MITVDRLTKRYGEKTAVSGLSFRVAPGKVTGFLGPNGAGKSTTMRVIVGLDAPTAGRALVAGRPCAQFRHPLREVGALLDARAGHPGRSAHHHLLGMARSNGIPASRVGQVLESVGLGEVAGKRLGSFSLGMGQRLGIAAALLGDPEVLLFDEPVNGLDPDGVRWVRGLMRSLAAEGRTVFVSSHLMSEMQDTADHVIVIGRGRVIADAPVEELLASSSHSAVRIRSPRPELLRQELLRSGMRVEAAPGDDPEELIVVGGTLEEVGDLAFRLQVPVHGLAARKASLEQAYMELTASSVEYGTRAPEEPGDTSRTSGQEPPQARRPSQPYTRRQPQPVSPSQPVSQPPSPTPSPSPTPTPAPSPPPSPSLSEVADRQEAWSEMTTSMVPPLTAPAEGGGFKGALAFEWTKLWSVRATWWNLLVGLVLTVGFAMIVGMSAAASGRKGLDVTMPAPHQAAQAFLLSQLSVVVLATLAVTSEYSSGSIRSTLQSVPARGRMLLSKTLVVAGVVAVAGFVLSVLGSLAAAAFMGEYGEYTGPDLFGTALGAAGYLALLASVAIGLGTVLRSAAGTLTTLIMVLLALPQLLGVVGARWLETAGDYLPGAAGTVLMTQDTEPYGSGVALVVLLAWAVAAWGGGRTALRHRDA